MSEVPTRLSYKFQRLRERVREAIVSGELTGKLPGERALAKRFKVNAKTLSKALTDLAAEGLLDRSIGLGTFVKGSKPVDSQTKVLVLTDSNLVEQLTGFDDKLNKAIPGSTIISGDKLPAINELNAIRFAIILGNTLSDESIRDLIVRGKTIISIQRTVGSISSHSISVDTHAQIVHLARHLAVRGHKSFWLNLQNTDHNLLLAVHKAIDPIVGSSEVHIFDPSNVDAIRASHGVVICENQLMARELINSTESAETITNPLLVAAVGIESGDTTISGQYASLGEIFEHVQYIIQQSPLARPVTFWLSGRIHEGQTVATAHKSRV